MENTWENSKLLKIYKEIEYIPANYIRFFDKGVETFQIDEYLKSFYEENNMTSILNNK